MDWQAVGTVAGVMLVMGGVVWYMAKNFATKTDTVSREEYAKMKADIENIPQLYPTKVDVEKSIADSRHLMANQYVHNETFNTAITGLKDSIRDVKEDVQEVKRDIKMILTAVSHNNERN